MRINAAPFLRHTGAFIKKVFVRKQESKVLLQQSDTSATFAFACLWIAVVAICCLALLIVVPPSTKSPAAIWRQILRLILHKGRRCKGELTGLVFPTRPADLLGPGGAAWLTRLLRHNGHLPGQMRVSCAVPTGANIRDGVKGDKVILELTYGGWDRRDEAAAAKLPKRLFCKFGLQARSPMRLLCDLSHVAMCESLFYHHLASAASVPSPRAYFADYSSLSGESCLISDVIHFELPPKHRIRDAPLLEEHRAFVVEGGTLNAKCWLSRPASGREEGKEPQQAAGTTEGTEPKKSARAGPLEPLRPADAPPIPLERMPRFDEKNSNFWVLVQLIGRLGLHRTVRKMHRGRPMANRAFATWEAPAGLVGREAELISDMPDLLRSLCADEGMLAYGHNDITTDNAYFWREVAGDGDGGGGGRLRFGLVDWQQACVNNVGQEWAWNLHFLPPEFLTAHEDELITLLLRTYAEHGVHISRRRFLRAYVLGTVQMYVFGGGGLQMLLSKLEAKGLLASLVPDDPRCRGGDAAPGVDDETLEQLVGAEMTRRTFTNCCNIMRRHDFVGEWRQWKEASRSSA